MPAITAVSLPISVATSVLLAAGALHQEKVELRFAPSLGATLSTQITSALTQKGGDLSVVMGGQEVPAQFLPKISYEFEYQDAFEISDRFDAAPEDVQGHWRTRTVERATSRFEMSLDMGDGNARQLDAEGSSPLQDAAFGVGRSEEGETVARWSSPDESAHPGDECLDGVRAALDLAALLPEDPVEIGDTWSGPASALAEILEPSGDLAWAWTGTGADEMRSDEVVEHAGELELKLVEVSGSLATIEVRGKLVETRTTTVSLDEVPVADGEATEVSTTAYDIEAELRWDIRAHVLAALELEAEGTGDQETTRNEDQPGPTYASNLRHTGALKLQLEATLALPK